MAILVIDLLLSTKAFDRWATQIGGALNQVPFAMSKAMNDAAFATRTKLIEDTWPAHVTVRNKGFLRGALRVEKASKHSLAVAITDKAIQGRGHLALHAKGGTKPAKTMLAIPDRKVGRGAHGVVKSQLPRNLKNSFRKGDIIYQRVGAKGHQKLKLMYVLKRSAAIKADVPFHADFKRFMLAELQTSFPKAMAYAMGTRK